MSLRSLLESILEQSQTGRGELKVSVSLILCLSSRRWYWLIAEIKPTPKPAKNLPATKRGIAVAAVCKMTPKIKTNVDATKPNRRPIRSAIGAAVRAPKNVPADRMETIVAVWEAVVFKWPVLSLYPVENLSCQYGIARMPLIVPVSYLSVESVICILHDAWWIICLNIPEEHPTKGDEHADQDGGPWFPRSAFRLLQTETHLLGAATSRKWSLSTIKFEIQTPLQIEIPWCSTDLRSLRREEMRALYPDQYILNPRKTTL